MKPIRWLFFDVGSTLMDESFAYEHRLSEIAQASGLPFERVYELAMDFYRRNLKGDLETASLLQVQLTPWHHEDEHLYPEAIDTLRTLHSRFGIGIIANQSLGTADRLREHGILDCIDLVISSAEEGVSKPDHRIFDIALAKSGCSPDEAVMIGDRIDNDIVPAKCIGMHTVWIQQGFGQYWTIQNESQIPEYTIHNLSEICDLFSLAGGE